MPRTRTLLSLLVGVAWVALSALTLPLPLQAQEIPQTVLEQNSLAASEIQNGNYEGALPYLRWLLENAPTVYNSERIHRRAVTAYSSLADSTADVTLKAAYLDTALTILRTAPATFEDGGVEYNRAGWEIEFGNFLVKYGGNFEGLRDQAVDHFRTAYEIDPENTDPYYIKLIVGEYVRLDRIDEAVSFMDEVESQLGKETELAARFEEIRDRILQSPEDRVLHLSRKLARDSTDVQTVRELFSIYKQLGRADDVEAIGELLLALDPTVGTYMQVADLKYENGQYEEALHLYDRALELTGPDSAPMTARDIEFKMAASYYELDRLQASRVHARRALAHDPKFGLAYILIGDLLVKAVSGSAFERTDKAVYWLAIDYYERAASVDPELREMVMSKVQRYRPYMPSKEEKFFAGWTEGDTYAVDYGRYGWVDETTRVR